MAGKVVAGQEEGFVVLEGKYGWTIGDRTGRQDTVPGSPRPKSIDSAVMPDKVSRRRLNPQDGSQALPGLTRRQRNQADTRVITPQRCNRRHPVQVRHVRVEDDRVRLERLRQLDRLQPVERDTRDLELRLGVNQTPQRLQKR